MIDRLGAYLVERKLADGGMGAVYKGTAPDGQPVVLKVPHAHDRDAMIALADEARTGARLRHASIVETLDFFEHERKYVLVVEYIDGVTLFELRKHGPLPAEAILEAGAQLASALDAIHTATDESGKPLNIVHRDVSPNNVIVDRHGQLKLIDLGIARSSERRSKQTMQGMVKGTIRYLAPEILIGGDHGPATDLWALGLTLWEAAVGRYAVPGDEMNTVRAAVEGTVTRLLPGEYVDGSILEVLGALIAPIERRLKNARATATVFARMAAQFPGGREQLAEAVRSALERTVIQERAPESRPEPVAATEVWQRPAATEATPASALAKPVSAVAPTMVQMPAAHVSAPASPVAPTMLQMPAAQVSAVAPTMVQMPAAKVEPRTDPIAPTLMMAAAKVEPKTDPVAPTMMQMPAATIQMPSAQAQPAPPASPAPPDMESAPTIQMPMVQVPEPKKAEPKGPAQSLFLPIVVVDEMDDE